jgi:CHASE3 domain sensor protein
VVQLQPELMPTRRHPRALILSRPAVVAVIAAAFSLILATGLLTAFSTVGLSIAEQRAAQAQRTLGLALQFLTTLSDASADARRAILTGDAPSLARYRATRERQQAEFAALRAEFDGRDDLAPQFATLERLTDERLRRLDQALAVGQLRGPLPALATLDAAETAQPAAEIRLLLATLQRREFNQQAAQAVAASHRAETIRTLNLVLLLVAIAFAAGVGRWLMVRAREVETAVTVCAWTRRVLWQGKWITFEEYLAKRFDVRCTHGICAEAAESMKAEAAKLVVPPELRATRHETEVQLVSEHSAAPFA